MIFVSIFELEFISLLFSFFFRTVSPTANFAVFIENPCAIRESLKIRRRQPNELLKRCKKKRFNMQRCANRKLFGKIYSIFVLLSKYESKLAKAIDFFVEIKEKITPFLIKKQIQNVITISLVHFI